ncbi:hypothetical protein ACE6ED_13220 [Paenibacillus sp. CN-4]|uniref:hypothetical protein n=1 Tax=Paenibacillus nanchangensis TaxID=3348343 RepID=UPI003979793B
MAITPEQRNRYMLRELEDIFESLEYRLYEKLEAADHIVAQISSEASTCNIPAAFSQAFIREKLIDMIDQIAERREHERGKMVASKRVVKPAAG